jgi:hypothetical protein
MAPSYKHYGDVTTNRIPISDALGIRYPSLRSEGHILWSWAFLLEEKCMHIGRVKSFMRSIKSCIASGCKRVRNTVSEVGVITIGWCRIWTLPSILSRPNLFPLALSRARKRVRVIPLGFLRSKKHRGYNWMSLIYFTIACLPKAISLTLLKPIRRLCRLYRLLERKTAGSLHSLLQVIPPLGGWARGRACARGLQIIFAATLMACGSSIPKAPLAEEVQPPVPSFQTVGNFYIAPSSHHGSFFLINTYTAETWFVLCDQPDYSKVKDLAGARTTGCMRRKMIMSDVPTIRRTGR